jgi:hypothetical protein
MQCYNYEGCLKSSWTYLITQSQNFMEVQWWSLFWSTSLGKQCTSYNGSPISWKCAADFWSCQNFLSRSPLFMVGKAQKLPGVSSGQSGRCSNGFHWSSKLNTEFSWDLAPCDFWAFPTMKRELQGKFWSDQWSAACFWEVGHLPREVLWKRARHHMYTIFWHGIVRWVHRLCKWPSYIAYWC